MENIILETIKVLGNVLIAFTFVGIAVVQYIKEKWGLQDKAAEILSLSVGFVLGVLAILSYLEQMLWTVSISQGIGMFLFLIISTIGPSGGYKTLRSLLGTSQ